MSKKTTLFYMLLLISSITIAQKNEQTGNKQKSILKIEVVPLFQNTYIINYERVISYKSSIQLGLGLGNKNITDQEEFKDLHLEQFGAYFGPRQNEKYSLKTFTFNIDYKFYLKNYRAPKGLYISPSIQYLKIDEKFESKYMDFSSQYTLEVRERNFKLINFRILAGAQVFIAKRIAFNPYVGLGYITGDAKDYFSGEADVKGLSGTIGVNVGLGF